MSGFCADCGRALEGEACPSGHGRAVAGRGEQALVRLPRAKAGRRLAGSGIEYAAYVAGVLVLSVMSVVTAGILDALLAPLVVLVIAIRDVRSGLFSIGKRIAGLRVVQIGTGQPATNAQAVMRNSYYLGLTLLMMLPVIVLDGLAATLFGLCVVIDVLMIIATEDGRRLGDRLAGTQVVHQAKAA